MQVKRCKKAISGQDPKYPHKTPWIKKESCLKMSLQPVTIEHNIHCPNLILKPQKAPLL